MELTFIVSHLFKSVLFRCKHGASALLCFELIGRTSGVTDHFAQNDEHALALARRVVGTLNYTKKPQVNRAYIITKYVCNMLMRSC